LPKVDTSKATAVYRLFDNEGVLLYVGIAVDPNIRWRVHAREKTWWPSVSRRDVEWFPSRPAAEAAEVTAIASESPLYNVEHSTTRRRGDAKSEYRSVYTKPRQIRIATKAWADFGRATKAMGTTRAKVIVQLIAWYIRVPGARLPTRPERTLWTDA